MPEFELIERSSVAVDDDLSFNGNKKRKRSTIWNWFEEQIIDRVEYAICSCVKKFEMGKQNGASFSILRKMARDVLAILGSTIASESSFSTSGSFDSENEFASASKHVESPDYASSSDYLRLR